MKLWKEKKYSAIVGYGVGQYFEKTKKEVFRIIRPDYLCDRKWEDSDEKEYDGIALIKRKDLGKLGNALILVFTGGVWTYESIKSDLDGLGIDYIHVDEILEREDCLSGKELKQRFPDGIYEDSRGNKIYFDNTLSDKLTVTFRGDRNVLRINENVLIGNLVVWFGNHGFCSIGKNSEIIGAEICVSDAKVEIGRDCLLANGIIMRTHDAHHIFDRGTHRRINVSKDVLIGDNVWIAYRATLLGGAVIGTGSIVGTNAVTSGKFGEHQVVAGSPARVIRENVCWSRDNTEYFNRSCLEECMSKDALKYME